MSADRWAICPKCRKKAVGEKESLIKKAEDGYGQLSQKDYETIVFDSRTPINLTETLREDYEIYMEDDGLFSVEYSASCDTCGFKYNFNHSEQVEI